MIYFLESLNFWPKKLVEPNFFWTINFSARFFFYPNLFDIENNSKLLSILIHSCLKHPNIYNPLSKEFFQINCLDIHKLKFSSRAKIMFCMSLLSGIWHKNYIGRIFIQLKLMAQIITSYSKLLQDLYMTHQTHPYLFHQQTVPDPQYHRSLLCL